MQRRMYLLGRNTNESLIGRCDIVVLSLLMLFGAASAVLSASDTEAVAALEKLAADELEMYEAKVANRDDRDGQDRGDTQG